MDFEKQVLEMAFIRKYGVGGYKLGGSGGGGGGGDVLGTSQLRLIGTGLIQQGLASRDWQMVSQGRTLLTSLGNFAVGYCRQ